MLYLAMAMPKHSAISAGAPLGRSQGTSKVPPVPTRFLFFGAIISLYLQLSIGFPDSGFIICGGLLAVPAIAWQPKLFFPALIFASVGVISLGASIVGGIFYVGQIFSLGLLFLSLFATTGVAITAARLGPRRMAAWFWWFSVTIIVLAALEVLGPLRPVSDAVRTFLYPHSILYQNDIRDLALAGFVRPKVFTSEPSNVGKLLAIFLVISASSSRKRRKHLVAALVAFFVIYSPVILFAAVIVLLIIIRQYGFRRLLASPLAVLGVLLAGVGTLYLLFEIAHSRLGLFGGTVEASAYVRIILPLNTMREAIRTRPLLGFGLGAEESLTGIIHRATSVEQYVRYTGQSYHQMGLTYGSSLIAMILSFGLVGSLGWLWGLGSVRRTFGGDRMVFWLFWLGYGFFQAALNTPLHLAPMFLLAVSSALNSGRILRPARNAAGSKSPLQATQDTMLVSGDTPELGQVTR